MIADAARALRRVTAAAGVLAVAACTSSSPRPSPTTAAAPATSPSASTPDLPASGTPSAPTTPSTVPVPSTPLRTVTAHSADGEFVIQVWAEVKTPTCADSAEAQSVVTYLTKHPCTGLDRLLATTTVAGRPVGLAVSELAFGGTGLAADQTAGRFAALVKRKGTGALRDLLRDGYRLPSGPTSVPSTDAFNALAEDAGVAVFDAWYLDGPTPANDAPLEKMIGDVFLQV